MTGKIVSEVARLWLHTITHSKKGEHKGRYPLEKGTSQYERRQQGCATAKGWDVDKKDHRQDYDVGKKSDNRRKWYS